jgi:hypothetical protein
MVEDAAVLPRLLGPGVEPIGDRDTQIPEEGEVALHETRVGHRPHTGDILQSRQLRHDLLYLINHGTNLCV